MVWPIFRPSGVGLGSPICDVILKCAVYWRFDMYERTAGGKTTPLD